MPTGSRLIIAALAVALGSGACAHSAHRAPTAPVADAPVELDDDLDLADQVDRLHTLPPGAERAALRAAVITALVGRIDELLAIGRNDRVDAAIRDLASLWTGTAAAMGAELAPHVDVLHRARATFGRAGGDREIALVLVLLAAAEPARAAEYRAELTEVLDYADALEIARYGELAGHSGAIAALGSVVARGLAPDLVDAHVERLVDRANRADAAVAAALSTSKPVPDSGAIRLGFRAARDIAIAYSAVHRDDAIAPALARLQGIGKNSDIEIAAGSVGRADARPEAWVALARAIRNTADDADEPEPALLASVSLTICLDALARFPDDAAVLAAAADHAIALDRVHQPIALYERGLDRVLRDPALAERLALLYRERLAHLVYGARPNAARARVAELRAFYDRIEAAFPQRQWDSTWADVLATYGRGLVSQGALDEARAELQRSLRAKPTASAHEMLGTIAFKLGDYATARTHFDRGAALGDDDPNALYARAKILRLGGDAAHASGDVTGARRRWLEALELWSRLDEEHVELPPNLAGERLVEAGKLLWSLGQRDKAVELFDSAAAVDPDGADTHVHVVAFLLAQGEIDHATDAVYAALASDGIGEYYKVYLSLWLVVEARQAGRPDDRQAAAYLASRDGRLWYDDVARLATGRLSEAELAARATTRGRRAELSYYSAVLRRPDQDPGRFRRQLEDVVATGMVLFFEYEMARRWLDQPR